ncbi:hypothetical protein POM88_048916 [Heracleum sosnowskyi]|uniref:Uncharacterized protein n=1 Tax=Heracleum sosnowskyi TaxID=360622 RepID=A0AAD8GX90_9APIA|nr:hypothetical protein POM88_048916 [Heracleum sosnowskyi]
MNDCLARIDYGPGEATDVDVYGYDEEHRFWNKMHTINISKTCTFSHITCFKYDAEIVFFDENKMYFPRLNEIKVLGRCHDETTHATCSFSYTPSLVAVKGMKSLRCRDSHRSLAGITSRLCAR